MYEDIKDKNILIEEKNKMLSLLGLEMYNIINFRDYDNLSILRYLKDKVSILTPRIEELNRLIKKN